MPAPQPSPNEDEKPASALAPIEDIIEEARNGRIYILVDAEDRENEGDLIIPAQFATPDVINFMAKEGRGLICLSLTQQRARELDLRLMSSDNRSRHQTAFTVSIEAREGVSTGISAHDRAHTITTAIDLSKGRADIVSPGHVFPLVAKDGGVLARAGHTEAAVDISRLAGLNPSGVICEIMNDDGSMARLPDLIKFADRHGLKIGAISDLIAYRRRNDRFVERQFEAPFDCRWGEGFRMVVYKNTLDGCEHVALVKGTPNQDAPTLVRMHKVDFAADVAGERGARGELIEDAIRHIDCTPEGGVIVFIREANKSAIAERFGPREVADEGEKETRRLREYGVGAQILLDLGVREMKLLSNTSMQVVGLSGYGLSVVDHVRIDGRDNDA